LNANSFVTAFFHYESFVNGMICFIQGKKLCMMITSSQSLLSRSNEDLFGE